jgi:hypothetical protein
VAEKKPSALTPEDCARVAQSIAKISNAALLMKNAGLSRRAILVLIRDATNLPLADIRRVLDAVEDLASWCLVKK